MFQPQIPERGYPWLSRVLRSHGPRCLGAYQLMIGILLCLGSTVGALLMALTPVKQAADGSSPSTW